MFTQDLHNPKVVAWCGLVSFGIIFFKEENNRAVTVNMLKTFFISELNILYNATFR